MCEEILIKIDLKHINYINRIMEGYEYLGVVTTVKDMENVLRIRVTPDTYREVQEILANLPLEFEYVKLK
ncbi:MAG: peptidase, family protein [Firmicutes bacterium]|nr:peptidase, family protein [Bacillota bacterium]